MRSQANQARRPFATAIVVRSLTKFPIKLEDGRRLLQKSIQKSIRAPKRPLAKTALGGRAYGEPVPECMRLVGIGFVCRKSCCTEPSGKCCGQSEHSSGFRCCFDRRLSQSHSEPRRQPDQRSHPEQLQFWSRAIRPDAGCAEHSAGDSGSTKRKVDVDLTNYSTHRVATDYDRKHGGRVWIRRHESNVLLLAGETGQVDLGRRPSDSHPDGYQYVARSRQAELRPFGCDAGTTRTLDSWFLDQQCLVCCGLRTPPVC